MHRGVAAVVLLLAVPLSGAARRRFDPVTSLAADEAAAETQQSSGSGCKVQGHEPTRIAVVLFGMLRDVGVTQAAIASLQRNVLEPLEAVAPQAVDVYMHTWSLSDGIELLQPWMCASQVDDQDEFDERFQTAQRAAAARHQYNDKLAVSSYYQDSTFMNIYRAKQSARQTARLVEAQERQRGFNYTHVLAARPDSCYLSPLVWDPLPGGIRVPNRHHFDGVNDQFAFGDARVMLSTYLRIIESDQLASRDGKGMGESEAMLCRFLAGRRVKLGLTPLCAARMHSGGNLTEITPDENRRISYPDWPSVNGSDADFSVSSSPHVCCAAGNPRRTADGNQTSCTIPPEQLLSFAPMSTDSDDPCAAAHKRTAGEEMMSCTALLQEL